MPSDVLEQIEQLQRDIDEWMKIDSHPVDGPILRLLGERAGTTTNELAEAIDTSESSLYRSLRRLREAGMIERAGGRGRYRRTSGASAPLRP